MRATAQLARHGGGRQADIGLRRSQRAPSSRSRPAMSQAVPGVSFLVYCAAPGISPMICGTCTRLVNLRAAAIRLPATGTTFSNLVCHPAYKSDHERLAALRAASVMFGGLGRRKVHAVSPAAVEVVPAIIRIELDRGPRATTASRAPASRRNRALCRTCGPALRGVGWNAHQSWPQAIVVNR